VRECHKTSLRDVTMLIGVLAYLHEAGNAERGTRAMRLRATARDVDGHGTRFTPGVMREGNSSVRNARPDALEAALSAT